MPRVWTVNTWFRNETELPMNDATGVTAPSAEAQSASPGFLTGLLLGGLVGITVAMIVAPQAGDETRDLLRAKAREASEGLREAADDLSKSAQSAAEGVSASANDLLARGKQIVDDARTRFDVAVSEGKEAAAQQRSILENEA
jgi:gas vesicle protein